MVTVIISSERILPCEATPKAPLWLSNVDLAARNAHIALVYFYRCPLTADHDSMGQDFFDVESLKSSLAKVLVPFYPLAGRLGVDQDGRAEVCCDGEGALFVVAEFDGRMDDLEPFAPSPEMKALFVPPAGRQHLPDPILMVQVTFFKCGGVALGTAMNHMLADGRSAFHFMDSWSKTACGGTGNGDILQLPPSFDHTPLRARSVPKVLFDHSEYKSSTKPTGPRSDVPALHAISVQELSNKQVNALRLRCKGGGDAAVRTRMSTFCAITTLVWRCFCVVRKLDSKSESKLYTMIDMRNRMKPPLPPTYFGNAVIRISVTESVRDVASSPINQLARRVHEATKKGDDYARSLIDYLETADMGDLPRSGVPRNELRVISWLGMPTLSADLGWGKPVFFAAVYYSGYVFLMDSLSKDGGVSVMVSLEPEILPEFEKLFWEEIASLDA